MRLASIAIAAALAALPARAEMFPFAMPWDDASANLTNIAAWNHKPAGRDGFARVEGGHLYAGAERLRLLGVNIVFEGATPTREEADRIAARLARFGVNAVRFHHLDTSDAPRGLLQRDRLTFDPERMERLDYFIAALKREGIYVNINLHVGRRYPGFADWGEATPKYWKGVDIFFPPMVAMQKDYARGLLTHRNPFTGARHVDEPAVALVEINNENGLLRGWRLGELDDMPDPYRAELARQWNAWLRARHGDDAALRRAWGSRSEPPGAEMLTARLGVRAAERGWNLQLVGDARAVLEARDGDGAELTMTAAGKENWHTQLHQNGLAFEADRPYTLRLALRADKPTRVSLQVMQAHAPWRHLWRREVVVGTGWTEIESVFAPAEGDAQARLTIGGVGRETGRLALRGASLRPGGQTGIGPGESLAAGTLPMFEANGFMGRTPPAQRDWLAFLWDTETAYWTGMRTFLRDELGVRVPVIGTQASYSPAPIQALMDVVDDHAYWQHPVFPGKPWDPANWFVHNSPMAGVEDGGKLPDLALRRVPGKPFVVTEYNHASPSLYQAEALPLLAAYAALQDWDGVFLYSYGRHGKSWDPGCIDNFFDSHANPVKMAGLVATAALFRRGDVATPGAPGPAAIPDPAAWIEVLRGTHRVPGADAFGTPRAEALIRPASLASPPGPAPAAPHRGVTGELTWGWDGARAVAIATPRSMALIGARPAQPVESGGATLELADDWGVLLATVLEGDGFAGGGRILLSTLGGMANTGQAWTDERRMSLGRAWGGPPVLVDGPAGRLTLPVAPSRVRAWALDGRGERRAALPIADGPRAVIETGARHQTLWYEIEVTPPAR